MDKIKRIGAIFLTFIMLFCMASCIKTEDLFIEDGDFLYYNLKNTYMKEDCYAIVGTTEQGLKENIYMPTHFRGKEVKYTSFTKYGAYGGVDGWGMNVGNCKRLYFNYLHESNLPYYIGSVEQAFFSKTADDYCATVWGITCITKLRNSYVNALLYENVKNYFARYPHITDQTEINEYIYMRTTERNNSIYITTITKGNTSYMFNYEKSPNNDYFFINNFESDSLIDNTPYEPIREGYTFAGWYKEPSCEDIWNFEEDRLPKFEYDSDGYITNFVETKLYAKWVEE